MARTISIAKPLRISIGAFFAIVFVVQAAPMVQGQTPAQPKAQTGANIPAAWLGGSMDLNRTLNRTLNNVPNDGTNNGAKNTVRNAGAPNQNLGQNPIGAVMPAAPAMSQAQNSPGFTGKISSMANSAANAIASPIARTAAAGDVIGFTSSDGSGSQTITLVHTGKSWMAVYHIDRSGTIQLVSSRPIDADFALQLNATSPLPDDIREMGKR